MDTNNHKILSFEEFMNSNKPEAPETEMPGAEPTNTEIPAHDGDPEGDMPVTADLQLVDGPSGEVEPELNGTEGDEGTEEVPAEGEEPAEGSDENA